MSDDLNRFPDGMPVLWPLRAAWFGRTAMRRREEVAQLKSYGSDDIRSTATGEALEQDGAVIQLADCE